MYNWSTDEEKFKKEDPEGHKIWRIEQMVNFGLDGDKIPEEELRHYWDKINIDPARRKLLNLILYGE
ncbi:MAG: hypothetical protein A2750_01005 [Candidatus Yanofskybacteria bacterium RIFCSPHIGHO2_01_FULL_45_42]|uniref:Uncharacterized protein n=3 Tax=Candidatus Yanofskyibacteriota TaxID=1752733 RepID=A0A1F8H2S9_9BACT|nr:MAG: hypothetical protein A2750_01005 [Candidatus Yanofskybacteria bacterium RIFCSPHIGHO2_01_FULL_45_42]OGN15492.1 MAG: hypothetical protein A3C81_01195 [Candidatus Yanofskybacteria bacterium RIFCSPHIGHO2_02_FULL_46_19]OGN27199.1 MAG: hypothetical protein A3B17_01105 [Candidatus Yanofskybacteria bacterium RIFCSPLOWO2_01_FULL_45_72]OGN31861.1 MAG: hypothetical protein A3J01_01740 [Candidatus Yanofskybacteria bacterium RIFCSPLOWO2_02_FULL_45_18]